MQRCFNRAHFLKNLPIPGIMVKNAKSNVQSGALADAGQKSGGICKHMNKQESIPVGCILPIFLVVVRGVCQPPPCRQTPLDADPRVGRPLLDAGHMTCDACWEANLPGCWS